MEKNVSIDILRRTIPKLRKRTPYPQEQNSILFISSCNNSADIEVVVIGRHSSIVSEAQVRHFTQL
jgi:hypothetical protein